MAHLDPACNASGILLLNLNEPLPQQINHKNETVDLLPGLSDSALEVVGPLFHLDLYARRELCDDLYQLLVKQDFLRCKESVCNQCML